MRQTSAGLAILSLTLTWTPGSFDAPRDPMRGGASAARVVAGQLHIGSPLKTLASGRLLVASRHVGDLTFGQSIVLLFSYADDGAAGLIVNRPSSVPVPHLLPDVPVGKPEPTAFYGGPVQLSSTRALLRSPAGLAGALLVTSGVYLLGRDALNTAVDNGVTADRLRVYVGYAGWGAGQLESEVQRGDWHVFDGDAAVVFDRAPDTLWRREVHLAELPRI